MVTNCRFILAHFVFIVFFIQNVSCALLRSNKMSKSIFFNGNEKLRKLFAINRGRTSVKHVLLERLQILADYANIGAKVAKPLTSFAEYPLRRVYPQAQSSANQNKRLTAWNLENYSRKIGEQ